MKNITENTKFTLTLKQIKELLKEDESKDILKQIDLDFLDNLKILLEIYNTFANDYNSSVNADKHDRDGELITDNTPLSNQSAAEIFIFSYSSLRRNELLDSDIETVGDLKDHIRSLIGMEIDSVIDSLNNIVY